MPAAPRIATREDLRAIEAQGRERWMPFTHVFQALADVAARQPERCALTALASAQDPQPRRWTYAQLLNQIVSSANLFRALGAADGGVATGAASQLRSDPTPGTGPEPRVALLLPPLPEAWFALWGAETAGIAVPINHALADDHLLVLLNAAEVSVIVTLAPGHPASDIGERVQRLRGQCPTLRAVVTVGGAAAGTLDFDTACARFPGQALAFEPVRAASQVAALFHTGGTTGLPKLAQHTHANQLYAAWGAARLYDARETDVILNGFPLFHVAGAFVYGLSMLLAGAEIVLPPPAGFRDPAFVARAWPLMHEHGITVIAMVPTVMSALLAARPSASAAAWAAAPLSVPLSASNGASNGASHGTLEAPSLRLALTGGSPLPNELAARFESETGLPLRNILGMTECAGVIAIEPALAPRTPGSCGLPLPFGEVVVDAEGVLRVRGPHVGPGYTDPARNPGTFEGGWLVTGDIGQVDAQGRVFVTGRAKDVIIRSAHNIDPGVIEEALMQHPEVALAAAVGEPDEYAGELPVAFVVLKPGAVVDPVSAEAELLAFAAQHVPERAAVPKRITLLPALPLTAIGKVYKPALRALAAERVLGERLYKAGLAEQVVVMAQDAGGRLTMVFTERGAPGRVDGCAPRTPLQPPLGALMAGFALNWKLVSDCSIAPA